MILLLDNFDSFTYNLVDYFGQLGRQCHVVRNDEPIDRFSSESWDGLVISPGPEIPQKAGSLMRVFEYFAGKIPVLGICLGHQAIGEFYGARLVHAEKPMHGKVSRIHIRDDGDLFRGLPSKLSVVRYNSLVLEELPAQLIATAYAENGEIMALRHDELPVYGMQFHPEAILTENGLKMIQNWLECSGLTV
jgi:anthranilate synthase/aminodeoxychorismate synthase-like glutamine amidotransferase